MTIRIISYCADSMGVPTHVVRRIAEQAPHKYKRFRIKKKKAGEFRWVAQPAREVKSLQRAIVGYFSEVVQPSRWATAYVPGSSIAKNARFHAGAKHLLKLDFTDFFGSLKQEDVVRFLREITDGQISEVEERLVSRAVCWQSTAEHPLALCIGAPSSPFFSNVMLRDFDAQIGARSDELRVKFTRYSDDIALSGDDREVLLEIESVIRRVCSESLLRDLRINEDKRVLVGRSRSMSVTGLCLATQGFISIGRTRKRGIRSGVRQFILGRLDQEAIDKLRGEIAFATDVEKDFLDQLYRWYGASVGRLLLPRMKV